MSNTGFRCLLGAIAVTLAGGLWPVPAGAQTSIVALVNNTPITSTEVSERRGVVRLTKKKEITTKQALDDLIDQQLLLQEAKRRQLSVSDADVEQRFNGVAAGSKLSPEQLGQALTQGGASTRAFKAQIRSSLLERKFMGMLTRLSTGISEKEIAAGITAKKSEGAGTSYRYTMQQIVFVAPKDANAAVLNQRKNEAEGLRRRIQNCDQAISVAKELRDVAIKPPVVRMSGQLSSAFREALGALKVGQSMKPEASEMGGIEVVVLCDKQETVDDSALRSDVQNELMKEQGQPELDKFLADLRKRALIIYK